MSILNIAKTDFVGEIQLSAISTNTNLDYSIDQLEKEVLIKLLGIELYTAFAAGLEEETVLQKWTDLKDGKAFDHEDYDYKINFGGVKKMALYYIYSQHILNNLQNTPLGSGHVQSKNIINANNQRLKNESNRIYNKFRNEFLIAQTFIRQNISDYPNFVTTLLC